MFVGRGAEQHSVVCLAHGNAQHWTAPRVHWPASIQHWCTAWGQWRFEELWARVIPWESPDCEHEAWPRVYHHKAKHSCQFNVRYVRWVNQVLCHVTIEKSSSDWQAFEQYYKIWRSMSCQINHVGLHYVLYDTFLNFDWLKRHANNNIIVQETHSLQSAIL